MKALPIALTLLLLSAALPAAALPQAGSAGAALDNALDSARQYESLANRLAQGDALSTFVGLDAQAPVVSFDEAMNEYYAAMGIAMPDNFVAPPNDVAAALAPVIAAVARSATATSAALAVLDDEDRAFLLAHLEALGAPDASLSQADASRVQVLAAQVDVSKIISGAATLSVTMNALTIPPMAASWIDPTSTIEVGSTSNDCYYTPRVLIVDLGGNDCYNNEPASYYPGSSLRLPVSVILDLGGNDQYLTTTTSVPGGTTAYGQGVGLGGVGLIVDRWGDDAYYTTLFDASTSCPIDFWTGTVQNIFAQGTGLLGVGGITDLSGNDYYSVYNSNSVFNYCHFGFIYTYAQAAGLAGGVGILADGEGDDFYYAETYSYGKADSIASTFAQAVAVNGVALLVDKEGSDYYHSGATGLVTFGYTKGAFAYVFAQASTTTTHRLPQVNAAATITDAIIVTPAGVPDPCQTLGGSAGEERRASCDAAGVAVLVDILGDDYFDISPFMADYGAGCYNGGWSLGSGQGSAAWNGLAVLVNVDVEGRDSFSNHPTTIAMGCSGPGARAMAHGQGYGGPIVWNFWDAPNRLPLGPTPGGVGVGTLGVGVLASIGALAPQCSDPIPNTNTLAKTCGQLRAAGVNVPQLTASPDSYSLTPYVDGTGGYGPSPAATAFGQGAGTNLVTSPLGAYGGMGVGINIDTGGDDTYAAVATAAGASPYSFVLAQGAAQTSVGILVNVGGNDAYEGWAYQNGVNAPKNTLVQGYADGIPVASTPTICFSQVIGTASINCVHATLASALAVFMDIIGHESYSEAAERPGCMGTEPPIGTGTLPFGFLGDEWWGHVIGTPCSTPTPDTGSGTVIGLDWLSTINA